jgi:uncharacterized protein
MSELMRSAPLLLCCLGGIVDCFGFVIPQALKPLRIDNFYLNEAFRENNDEMTNMALSIPFGGGRMEFTWHNSIGEIPAPSWDSCLVSDNKTNGAGSSPFLEHGWIHSLEESGCASEATGWTPCHITIKIVEDDRVSNVKETAIDGCVPVYLKTHSTGEFIFDNAWADAAYRNQIEYYPKLLVGVPFTPVAGSRLLWHPRVKDLYPLEQLDRAVGTFLKQSAMARNLSSVHINFCTDEEAAILSSCAYDNGDDDNEGDDLCSKTDSETEKDDLEVNGDEDKDGFHQRLQRLLLRHLTRNETNAYLRRTTLQYHWHNRNPLRNGRPFADFEDYLTCFKSKRRITIRRERAVAKRGQGYNGDGANNDHNGSRPVRIDAVVGSDILQVEGLVERMFEIYRSTVDKLYWGRQYLTLDFFQRLCRTSFVRNLCFLCARYGDTVQTTNGSQRVPVLKAEDVFAGTFNVIKSGVFYGRYWGCLQGHDVTRKNLHFETCYWSAIDYCIQNGLERMEPGAGGGGK